MGPMIFEEGVGMLLDQLITVAIHSSVITDSPHTFLVKKKKPRQRLELFSLEGLHAENCFSPGVWGKVGSPSKGI